jgi:chromosome segregation ATPase
LDGPQKNFDCQNKGLAFMDYENKFNELEQRRGALVSKYHNFQSMMTQAQSQATQAKADIAEICEQYNRFASIQTDDNGVQLKQQMVLQNLAAQRAAAQSRFQAAQAKIMQCKNGMMQTLNKLARLRQEYEVLKSAVFCEAEKNKKAASSLLSLKQSNKYAAEVGTAVARLAEKHKKLGAIYKGCNSSIQTINGFLGNSGGEQREREYGR